jgi:hypothetical protein
MVAAVLAARDAILQQRYGSSVLGHLRSAYFHSGDVRNHGVYIWLHARVGGLFYVGSWGSVATREPTTLLRRTTQHLHAIAALQTSTDTALGRYRRVPQRGRFCARLTTTAFSHWYVFPLEIVPSELVLHPSFVFSFEQQWIDRFWARQWGLNSAHAWTAAPAPDGFAGARIFASRDMSRRVHAVWKLHTRGVLLPASDGEQHRIMHCFPQGCFDRYTDHTLARMHAFCTLGGADQHGSVTDVHGRWRVPESFLPLLRAQLDKEISSRYQRAAPARARTMMLLPAFNMIHDRLPLGRLLNDASCRQRLTQAQQQALSRAGRLAVGFKYTAPLGALMCNHARVARLSQGQMQSILSAPCICERRPAHVHAFLPEGHSHVITCNPNIITGPDTTLVEGLRWLFQQGAAHRPDALEVTMSPAVYAAVGHELRVALSVVAGNVPGLGAAHEWIEDVISKVQHILHSHRHFAVGQVLSTTRRAHVTGTRCVAWEDAFASLVSSLHQHFVITTADKVNKNFVVVCKKYYCQKVLDDLHSGEFYTPRAGGAQAMVQQL